MRHDWPVQKNIVGLLISWREIQNAFLVILWILWGPCEQYMFIPILLWTFSEKEVSAWQNDTSILKMTATSGKSFKCDQHLDIPLKAENKVKVMIKQIHLQPFSSDAKKEFGEG